MTPDEIAQACARVMYAEDVAARNVGIEIAEVRAGYSRLTMPVRPEQANGLGLCHGGFIFLLADTALAYASNSRNQRAVAAGATIDFVAPAYSGDTLTAEGVELHRGGRTALFDVRVTDQNGRQVALLRGKTSTIKGHFIEESQS